MKRRKTSDGKDKGRKGKEEKTEARGELDKGIKRKVKEED